MKSSLAFFIGLRYTGVKRSSRSVSFLAGVSITGLAVGISLLLLVLSVMNGFDRDLKERILGLVPQAAIYHRSKIEDWQSLQKDVRQMPGVEAASPFIRLNALINHGKATAAVLLYGFDPHAEKDVSLINDYVSEEVQRRILEDEPVILLGKNVAQSLGVEEGEKIMLVVPSSRTTSRSPRLAYFEVAQVIESKTELDATLALTSLQQAANLTGTPERVSGLRLKITNLFEAPSVMYRIGVTLGSNYYTSNWTRTHWNLYQAIQMSKNLVGLLMLLIVAIAAFNVVSTLVLVVVDKQGDIAILRTLGLNTRQIMAIFMVQGIVIGFWGVLLGIAIGCLLSLGIQDFVALVENVFNIQFLKSDVYPLTYLPTEIRLSDIASVTFTALGMSLIATIYPAWKASRVQPADALRYE